MKKNLPSVTLIGIDCVNLNKLKLAADICQKNFKFGKVMLLSSIPDADPRVIPIPKISSTAEYSEFCVKELWKYVSTSHALVIQHDGFILNPLAWRDAFLKYDYIGAPWCQFGAARVGNGGFSLRSKRLLDLIGKNHEKIGGKFHPEDLWICKTARDFLEKNGAIFAPEKIAANFSKEGDRRGVFWNGEFGFHGLTYTDISKWLLKHPEYKEAFAQKLDDFTTLMRKYPVYDGTVHVLYCKPIQVKNYKKLSRKEKNYDCRLNDDLRELDDLKPGHAMVYSLFRISLAKVGIPAFERKIRKIEKFSSKKELLSLYPNAQITPSFNLPKWKQRLAALFGNVIYPNNALYTLIWFEKK